MRKTNQILQFNKVSFEYEESSHYIIKEVTVSFNPGWTGIVGANGSGKSTLLKLASQELKPMEGNIKSSGLVVYCEQRTDYLPEGYEVFINSFEKDAYRIQDLLNISTDMFNRWDTLSHGERKRCQIATALFHDPDILIIDEPTNHIDSDCRKILLDSLKLFKGIGLIVSHDRELLNTLCNSILEIKDGTQTVISGNYDTFESEMEKKTKFIINERQAFNQEIKKIEKEVLKRKVKVSQTDKRISKRDIGSKDFDAKSKIDAARLTGKDAVDNKKYAQLKQKMTNIISKRDKLDSTATRELGIKFDSGQLRKSEIIFINEAEFNLGKDKLLYHPDLLITKDQKVGVIGKNGSGKSTLIKKIVNMLSEGNINYSYIPQEISIKDSKALLKFSFSFNSDIKGKVFTIISRLNSDPKKLLDSELPSPGEVRKLMLANAILNKSDLIIMDEPTNHMDLPSIKCLEETLIDYNGALLLVSHDLIFLHNVTETSWYINEVVPNHFSLTIK